MNESVAVIIPALNEAGTIADVVRSCLEVGEKHSYELVALVVDDGSTDDTAELARRAGARVISHGMNKGVGKAFQTGLEAGLASGSGFIVNIDGDGQFDARRIPDLLDPIARNRADVTMASRFISRDYIPEMPWIKKVGNYWMSHLISRLANRRFSDVSCGFRAYSREAALHLNVYGDFTYTHESVLDMVVKGMRITEVPMKIQGVRSFGKSRVASNLWRYALKTMSIILRTYRDYWPFLFFGRLSIILFVPGVLLVSFLVLHRLVSGSFFPHIWSGFIGGGLIALSGLVLFAGIVAEMLKRIRLNQERLLYYHKKAMYERNRQAGP